MGTQRSIRVSLAGAIVLTLFGMAPVATGQTTAPQPATQPVPPPPPTTTTMPAQPMPAQPQQTMPPQQSMPPQQPMPPQTQNQAPQPASGQFYQGTKNSARYPLAESNGGTLTVNAGMPDQVKNYGPPPSFAALDANHDSRISESEAQAYPPLDSDFLYASGEGTAISRSQYQKWVQTQQ